MRASGKPSRMFISVPATQYKVLKRNKIKTGIRQAPKISLTTGGTLKER